MPKEFCATCTEYRDVLRQLAADEQACWIDIRCPHVLSSSQLFGPKEVIPQRTPDDYHLGDCKRPGCSGFTNRVDQEYCSDCFHSMYRDAEAYYKK